jgi:hypothetical protein
VAIHVRDNRGGNWSWFHNAVLDCHGPELGPFGIAVYMVLCRHASNTEQATWVGQRTIAEGIGCSKRQVQREVDKLTGLGLIAVQEYDDEHGQRSNIYTLLSPPIDSQSRGDDQQSPAPSQAVVTPGLPVTPINKTRSTRPMDKTAIDHENRLIYAGRERTS